MYPTFASRGWTWLKMMYLRITLTRITAIFFLFSFVHCFIHSIVQSVLFSFDQNADAPVQSILREADVPDNHFAWLTRHHGDFTLQLCKAVPVGNKEDPCVVIFQSGTNSTSIPSGFRKRGEDLQTGSKEAGDSSGPQLLDSLRAGLESFVDPITSSAGIIGVNVSLVNVDNGREVFLNEQCTRVLVYADQVLTNSKREELALIGSEFWLLGISVFAIMYDSIPHLLAGLSMRVLSTGWSAYSIWRTRDIHTRFQVLITDGPCGVNLFPEYFRQRGAIQIADLALNVVALAASCFLVWRLVKTYATQMFKRVGAPEHVLKLYGPFLGVFICLQLSVYVLVTPAALWVDQLINGAIAKISSHTTVYIGLFVFTLVGLIPWISMGWYSVRREMRITMLAYLFVGFAALVCWSIMYYSQVFRWTWLQWPFFACLTVISQVVLIASIVLGIICRRNFNKGLAQYLYADDLLSNVDFEPEVFEHKPNGDTEKQLYVIDLKNIERDNVWNTLPSLKKRPEFL